MTTRTLPTLTGLDSLAGLDDDGLKATNDE